MSAINTTLKEAVVAGVASKVETFRFDDPKFAQIEPTTTGTTRRVDSSVTTIDGVSSPLTNRSKEGFGTGGYDKNFNIY